MCPPFRISLAGSYPERGNAVYALAFQFPGSPGVASGAEVIFVSRNRELIAYVAICNICNLKNTPISTMELKVALPCEYGRPTPEG